MNLSEFLLISSAIVPDRPAIIFEHEEISFDTLQRTVNNLASNLSSLGISPNDRIAVMDVNCPQIAQIFFAVSQLDAVYVPINFRARSEELHQMLEACEPCILFIGTRYLPLLDSIEKPHNLTVIVTDSTYFSSLLKGDGDQSLFPEHDTEDTSVIMFTAGTTGNPKGVLLSHDSFSSYMLSNVTPADPEEPEKNILTVPLYHIAGLQALVAGIYGGRTIVLMRQFEPSEWLKLVENHSVDRAMLVPTMIKQLMELPSFSEFNLASLKVVTYGAAPMPINVISKALEQFPNVQFINAFGQTETASTITMLSPDDHIIEGTPEQRSIKLKRLTSIGKPLEDVEVMIVDEFGREVDLGTTGEIVARGERMMKGYWQQEAATAAAIVDGWIYTGDLAYKDEDGYIFLAGRSKDFIKRGGEMISPEEIEQLLVTHPDIEEAAVIGKIDEEWGEIVHAIVVVTPHSDLQQEEVVEFCSNTLASFKRPELVTFTAELPRNSLGKVLKTELRQLFS
tara:strand:- start:12025 stop:13551 length:1527 start_codon:yes stop_codon:yes gene_type:complete